MREALRKDPGHPCWALRKTLFVTALGDEERPDCSTILQKRMPWGRKPWGVLLYGAHVGAAQLAAVSTVAGSPALYFTWQ